MTTADPAATVATHDPDTLNLIVTALDQGRTIEQILATIMSGLAVTPAAPATVTPPVAPLPALTDEHRQAWASLLTLHGLVRPKEARRLTPQESADLARARAASSLLAGFLEASLGHIRDVAANHLDRVAEDRTYYPVRPQNVVGPDGEVVLAATERDKNNHYADRTQDPAPGTGLYWDRVVSTPNPVISAARLEALMAAGRITRADYLSLTAPTRVFSADRARHVFATRPDLFLEVAEHATNRARPTTSIYLREGNPT